ncbi:hypothetical protein FJTKL_05873 [Diaporthe vaccinii]|uniref:Uncharacterized protein n=1 Tax=Diaporthe vaccinii TaxID=105482 RepID=A0ABR4EY97_9PEZI
MRQAIKNHQCKKVQSKVNLNKSDLKRENSKMLLSPVVDDFKIVRLCVFASSKPCRISLISPKPHSNDTDFLQGDQAL